MNRHDGLLYAVASVALRYPSPGVLAGRADLVELARSLPGSRETDALRAFLGWWASLDPPALERAYVETFDLDKRCCLYLSYYLYGDRRQRGQEFVRLKRRYEAAGYRLAGRELPDYLPLMLEFAALETVAGGAVLAESRIGLELLAAALADAGSPWTAVVDSIRAALPRLDSAGRALVRRLAQEGPPGEQVGLEPFGPPEAMPASPAVGVPQEASRASQQ